MVRGASPVSVPRVVVVGGGFAGFHAMRRLGKVLPRGTAHLLLVNPTDYLLYSPLLPEVATGTLDPRDIAVSLRQALPHTTTVLGHVVHVDLEGRTLQVLGRDGESGELPWDRLVLAPGSVTRQFDTPGVAEHARGLKTIAEATYLRDHLLRQLDLADELGDSPDERAERRERLTVVAVGAGYTGAETVAQVQLMLRTVASRWDTVDVDEMRWVLVDLADSVLPELGRHLGSVALRYLRERDVEVRLGTGVTRVDGRSVELSDGTVVPTRTLLWSAGVAPSPLVARLGLPTREGRLVVDDQLRVPGHQHVWAAGDSAAVPDRTKPARDGERPPTPMTAQHAQRHGRAVARNVAASLGHGRARPYRHHDLGLVADFGGGAAVARPLGVPVTGPPAKALARGYHLFALPATANRVRVATDWLLRVALPVQAVQLSQVADEAATVTAAQATGLYGDAPGPP